MIDGIDTRTSQADWLRGMAEAAEGDARATVKALKAEAS